MFNIIALLPFIYNEKIQIINQEIIYKNYIREAINEALCECNRLSIGFQRIFPLKENIKNNMKYL